MQDPDYIAKGKGEEELSAETVRSAMEACDLHVVMALRTLEAAEKDAQSVASSLSSLLSSLQSAHSKDMFAGGIDTSSITTEWALGELLSNPIKMKEVQDELERVVGMSRLVDEADIAHLPYLRAVVKETMRLHPILPLLVPHKAIQECHISGYDIPPNTAAYVNVWAIGRDPSVWERPLEFSPERFLDCNVDVHGHHFELLPFGSGRRACPGLVLGLRNVQLMLASMLHCFNWSSTEKPNLREKFGIVMTLENPLVAKATPRSLPTLLFNE